MLLDLWLQAFKAKVGLSIQTDNRMLLRQHLYKARLASGNSELDTLVMLLPEQPDEIWLVHKYATNIGTNNESDAEPLQP